MIMGGIMSHDPPHDHVEGLDHAESTSPPPSKVELLVQMSDFSATRGYGVVLLDYLVDACGPKEGSKTAGRTALYGLQRPPMVKGLQSLLRCEGDLDRLLLFLLPYSATNAWDAVMVSLAPTVSGEVVLKLKQKLGARLVVETRDA